MDEARAPDMQPDRTAPDPATVKSVLRARTEGLTPSERQVADRLLQDYPVAGLQSITELAVAAQVSTPTVVRLARKLGFDGFTALQDALRREISDQIKRPLSRLDGMNTEAPHRLHRAAAAHASRTLPAMVEAPSSWDSTLAIMLLVEALVAEVQSRLGTPARARIEAMEAMFTATRHFRDFN